jgi:hypothetical protein
MTITAERFRAAVGSEPRLDDLQRCNCPQAGQFGHWYCGWCEDCDKPRFCVRTLPPDLRSAHEQPE